MMHIESWIRDKTIYVRPFGESLKNMSVNKDLPASRSTTKVTEYDLVFIL